jgi:hypothetical protein
MSTLGTLANLYNLSQLKGPNGEIMQMIFSVAEQQDILQDIPFFPANGPTSHKFLRETKLVTGTWVDLNDGWDPSKGEMKTYRAEIGMLASRLQIDEKFMDIEPNFGAYVDRMAHPHYEGLGITMADAFVLGSNSAGTQINGIETHITSASQTDEADRKMFQTYGGTGSDLSSILLVDWGIDKVYAVYPQGAAFTGVKREENPHQLVDGNNSKKMWAYLADFMWDTALVIADDRCIRRLGNIDSSGTSTNLLDSDYETDPIVDGLVTMKNMGRTADIYMNRTIWAQFWKVTKDKTNVVYDPGNPWKQPETRFGNNRIRFTDSLLNTETAIS